MKRASSTPRSAIALACALVLLEGGSRLVCAQRLPLRRYDLADGLPSSIVRRIYQDTKGYMWFGTSEGLSRFDGYRFVTYGRSDGLGHLWINDITEDAEGRLWVATNGGGVSRFVDDPRDPAAMDRPGSTPRKFISVTVGETAFSNRVNALVFDSRNTLWCATDGTKCRAPGRRNRSDVRNHS